MELSRKERWMVWNQYRILERLDPANAEDYEKVQVILERGYERELDDLTGHICSDDEKVSVRESGEVINIFYMFRALQAAFDQFSNEVNISPKAVHFHGFDGNEESKQFRYARYYLEAGEYRYRFTELRRSPGLNSRIPRLDHYRSMLAVWERSQNPDDLTREELIRITSV